MAPRAAPVCLKDWLLWSLLILPLAGALQQQPSNPRRAYPSHPEPDTDLSRNAAAAERRWRAAAADSLHTPLSGQHGFRDTHVDRSNTRVSTNERALATLSPAVHSAAVRAPPAPRSVTSADLSSRLLARSLQDWQVEDVILLATVDGNIHARDRKTGVARWQLMTDRPMVETIYHRHNRSVDEGGREEEDPLWIVEPSQDGTIYMYAPSSGFGITRLRFTVKELVERSPYATDGQPSVVYTAEKKNTLYTVDASNGRILKRFSPGGAALNEDRSCRTVNPLEAFDEINCEPVGTLTLGRMEYTIGVQDGNTGEQISTIRYFEWVPNNYDQDLKNQYTAPMDNKYIYTKHDGNIFGLDLATSDGYYPVPVNPPKYHYKLSSSIARVFDLVKPQHDLPGKTSLVVLQQPVLPSISDFKAYDNDRIFVNRTEEGSWYALSEQNYPYVTDGPAIALCYNDPLFGLPSLTWPMSQGQQEKFVGVHELSPTSNQAPGSQLVEAPYYPGLDAPPAEPDKDVILLGEPTWTFTPSLRTLLSAVLLVLISCGVLYQKPLPIGKRQLVLDAVSRTLGVETRSISSALDTKPGEENVAMIREAEPAQETIFPHDAKARALNDPVEDRDADDEFEKMDVEEAADATGAKEEGDVNAAPETKTKKRATRGKRGGKKAKEKEQQQLEAKVKKTDPKQTEVISVAASESPQVAGLLQINSLLIHTDKVIGQGSCGTSVFEGSFEGRDVAVKRMLSQYYELASQEVSFLQQSDDHPNVVRYFCQQKDDHFLYIAVELCQASLHEVWDPDKARVDARQGQLRSLKHSIQQDVPRTLQQLAAGLYHLHNLRIIHRDIKPQNILVAFPKRNQGTAPRLVISDFGLGKNLPENVSTLLDPTGNAGTAGWKAPELISQPRDSESRHSQSTSHNGGSENPSGGTSGVKRAADIFSLGCLFFWVLTDGIHPYEDENGWQQLRELNIKRDNKQMGVLERWSDAYEPMQLISSMLEHQPENRPTALQVLNHPFFWPAEKRLAFLCDCSDHFEREPRGVPGDDYLGDSWDLHALECRAPEVIGTAPFDFLSRLDRHFVDTLGRQRKYNGNRLLDLLRALRNKKNHYEDMPEDVKKRVGPLAGGYLNYWCHRFPRLLMACYEVVHEVGVEGNDRFRGYFVLGKV